MLYNYEYVNGTLGHVASMSSESILVKKMDGNYVKIQKVDYNLMGTGDRSDEIICSARGYPLILGTSITIHKSQGSSIDSCIIDLAHAWENSMIYVALSRVRTPEGLRVLNWNRLKVKPVKIVAQYYDWIRKHQPKAKLGLHD